MTESVVAICCLLAFAAVALTVMVTFAKIDDRFTRVCREMERINDKGDWIRDKCREIDGDIFELRCNVEEALNKLNVEEEDDE